MRYLFLVLICAISYGCRDAAEPRQNEVSVAKPQAAVKLTVLVVDDPEIARGIKLLAGEWSERSGGELAVSEMTLDEMLKAESLAADVVIYPSRQLGTLAMRGWLRPMRPTVLQDPVLGWGDFLTTLRDQVARYGNEVLALPLGEKPLVVSWQGAFPEKLPVTWGQVDEVDVGNTVSDQDLLGEFIARVVAATEPGDRSSLFFAAESMDARLTNPQIVQALESIVARGKSSVTETRLSVDVPPRKAENGTQFAPLLNAEQVYVASLDQWEEVEDARPPVVCGFSGRLVSVTSASRNAASAFKLIPWLVGGTNGAQLSQRSDATLWFRASQTPEASKWLEQSDAESWLTESLSRGDAYLLPRIPGIEEYLAILNGAVKDAVAGKQPAAEALAAAAEKWNALTDKLGRDSQRMAFNRHLGLAE
jgi:maltose-binding protein MalE